VQSSLIANRLVNVAFKATLFYFSTAFLSYRVASHNVTFGANQRFQFRNSPASLGAIQKRISKVPVEVS